MPALNSCISSLNTITASIQVVVSIPHAHGIHLYTGLKVGDFTGRLPGVSVHDLGRWGEDCGPHGLFVATASGALEILINVPFEEDFTVGFILDRKELVGITNRTR